MGSTLTVEKTYASCESSVALYETKRREFASALCHCSINKLISQVRVVVSKFNRMRESRAQWRQSAMLQHLCGIECLKTLRSKDLKKIVEVVDNVSYGKVNEYVSSGRGELRLESLKKHLYGGQINSIDELKRYYHSKSKNTASVVELSDLQRQAVQQATDYFVQQKIKSMKVGDILQDVCSEQAQESFQKEVKIESVVTVSGPENCVKVKNTHECMVGFNDQGQAAVIKYEPGKILGAGTTGKVYDAGEHVAKVVSSPSDEFSFEGVVRPGAESEAQTVANSRTLEISVGEHRMAQALKNIDPEGQYFCLTEIMMPYKTEQGEIKVVSRQPRLDSIFGKNKMTEEQAVHLFDALLKMHTAQIVHRDIKPDNLGSQGGVSKILDMGLATSEPEFVAKGQQCGSVLYSPTERHSNDDYMGKLNEKTQNILRGLLEARGAEQCLKKEKIRDTWGLALAILYAFDSNVKAAIQDLSTNKRLPVVLSNGLKLVVDLDVNPNMSLADGWVTVTLQGKDENGKMKICYEDVNGDLLPDDCKTLQDFLAYLLIPVQGERKTIEDPYIQEKLAGFRGGQASSNSTDVAVEKQREVQGLSEKFLSNFCRWLFPWALASASKA